MHGASERWVLAVVLPVSGCVAATAAGDGHDKDTGYLSDVTVEVDAEVAGRLVVDRGPGGDGRDAVVECLVDRQLDFAENTLEAAGLHLNLTVGDAPTYDVAERADARTEFRYRLAIELLVRHDELQQVGLLTDGSSLADRIFEARVPTNPEGFFK